MGNILAMESADKYAEDLQQDVNMKSVNAIKTQPQKIDSLCYKYESIKQWVVHSRRLSMGILLKCAAASQRQHNNVCHKN